MIIKGKLLKEPNLVFGNGEHIDPKTGITLFGPYDLNNTTTTQIKLGFVGKKDSIRVVSDWIENGKTRIEAKKNSSGHFYQPFPGFNSDNGFFCDVSYDQNVMRDIQAESFQNALDDAKNPIEGIEFIAALYLKEIRYLALNKKVDVIICCVHDELFALGEGYDSLDLYEDDIIDENDNPFLEDSTSIVEYNFRRLLKAKSMRYNIPLQLFREKTGLEIGEGIDLSSRYWNFFSALYYKGGGTPWTLSRDDYSQTCYAGISFHRNRDFSALQTSSAQIFNEHGNGIILRGGEAQIHKSDKMPHLNSDKAFELLDQGLKEYYESLKQFPKRVVLHKSSNYSKEEIEGFKKAASKHSIHTIELITILPSSVRLTSKKLYPPNRGTFVTLNNDVRVLYTRGFVPFYDTYPGSYIPAPIELRFFSQVDDAELVAKEILMLTKINWNSTRYDKKLPITLSSSKAVGEILKYIDDDDFPKVRYSFYM